ncbi:hypothetical protein CLOM_g5290 [Closterium sp. NIES-68]|nr:hypothetical protein CLOM_g5290 [Closterium sp. NIES-68]
MRRLVTTKHSRACHGCSTRTAEVGAAEGGRNRKDKPRSGSGLLVAQALGGTKGRTKSNSTNSSSSSSSSSDKRGSGANGESAQDSAGGMRVARFKTREEVMRGASKAGGPLTNRQQGQAGTGSGSLATTQIISSSGSSGSGGSGGSKTKNSARGSANGSAKKKGATNGAKSGGKGAAAIWNSLSRRLTSRAAEKAAAAAAARPAWVREAEYSELRELQRFMREHYARAEEILAGNLTAHWEANRGRRLAAVGAKLPRLKPDFIVSKTGKPGHCRTVQEAATKLIAAYKPPPTRFVVYIMKGIYAEKVLLNKDSVIFLGDGASSTVITYGASVRNGYTAFDSASVGVNADYFTAMGLTVVNSAGAAAGQAIALRTEGDKSAFYDCVFLGHQDTLAPDVGRQYFRNCTVRGTIDFVFGVAAAVFEDCTFVVRRSPPGYSSTVAAQGRVTLKDPSAFVFLRGKVVGESAGQYGYLARPWWPYSRTIFIHTFLSPVVVPAGWLEWSDATTKTIWGGRPYFAEFQTSGPGAKGRRVAWARPGRLTERQAEGFLPNKLLQLGSWVGETKIPYRP